MELEINIEDLLNKRRVESDRIEFKAGWNPNDIYHSVCAFANDFDNVGGGYILVGVEEKNGVAVRPVKGIEEQEIDKIQKEILGYNNTIIPAYFPKVIIEEVDKKMIMILWVTTGIQRLLFKFHHPPPNLNCGNQHCPRVEIDFRIHDRWSPSHFCRLPLRQGGGNHPDPVQPFGQCAFICLCHGVPPFP